MRLKIMMGIECLLTVACIPFLVVSETLIGSAVYVSIGLIVLAKLALVYMRHKNMKMTYKKSEIIATTILSVLFVIMISIFDILGSGFLHIDSLINVYSSTVAHTIQVWAYMIYIPAVCVSAFVLVRYMIHAALENRIGGGGTEKRIIGAAWESLVRYLLSICFLHILEYGCETMLQRCGVMYARESWMHGRH